MVWRPTDGRVRVANQQAADAVGLTLHELAGRSVFDLLALSPHVEVVSSAVSLGAVDSCTHRRARIVTRALEVDGSREAATLWLPGGCADGLWPSVLTWAETAPMVLGYADPAWCVTSLSAGMETLLSREAGDCVGESLGDLLPFGDAGAGTSPAQLETRAPSAGGDSAIMVLVAPRLPDEPDGYTFALVGEPEDSLLAGRVAELEQRLLNISTEIWAAGLGPAVHSGADGTGPPGTGRLEGLTSRQREILDALLDGRRVPSIARELFLSQSTVRNHLAALFPRFGVHSQAELIDRLREQIGDATPE